MGDFTDLDWAAMTAALVYRIKVNFGPTMKADNPIFDMAIQQGKILDELGLEEAPKYYNFLVHGRMFDVSHWFHAVARNESGARRAVANFIDDRCGLEPGISFVGEVESSWPWDDENRRPRGFWVSRFGQRGAGVLTRCGSDFYQRATVPVQ